MREKAEPAWATWPILSSKAEMPPVSPEPRAQGCSDQVTTLTSLLVPATLVTSRKGGLEDEVRCLKAGSLPGSPASEPLSDD